nr:bifunctional DNA primase/polymerase [Streptomonospora nanhaiensis]
MAAARRGWPVFPLRPGTKQPAIRAWERAATTGPDRIRAWWDQWPDANPGIATGRAGLVVIDLDQPKPGQRPPSEWDRPGITDGADVLAALAEQAGVRRLLLDTFTVRTRRGGTHLYYAAPPGAVLGNTSGTLGWLIDTRARGGYVVGPGSRVTSDDGQDGSYEVVCTAPPARLPGWLAHRLTPRVPPTTAADASQSGGDAVLAAVAAGPDQRRTAYATAALRGELDKVATAPEGQRNQTLYIAAVSLGQLAAQGLLDAAAVADALQSAAEANTSGPPNSSREIAATIHSGLTRGLTVPRRTRTPATAPKEAA